MMPSSHNPPMLLEDTLWLLTSRTNIAIYDFDFQHCFHTRSPLHPIGNISAVARVGAPANYQGFYDECLAGGIALINSPEEHMRASRLDAWYPLLEDLTPRSVCFRERPTLEQVKAKFIWPVFMKGVRQTNRHQRKLSIIESDADFISAMEMYAHDPILGWQDVVCREFVSLRPLADTGLNQSRIPRSYEFRTFWWKGELVGAGRYWWEGPGYHWRPDEQAAALAIAGEADRRANVPFLVVDVAQTAVGNWIVIECNDGQESGYAGVSPFELWQKILDHEKALL